MKVNQTLPQVVKLLPQPFEFDNKRKCVEFTFDRGDMGTYVVTDYVTGKKKRGGFRFVKERNSVNLLLSGLATLRNMFLLKRHSKGFEEA